MNTRVFYHPDFVLADSEIDTTIKSRWIAASLVKSGQTLTICEPKSIVPVELARWHSLAYINALQTGKPKLLAESSGLKWKPKIFPLALRVAGGMVAAAEASLKDGVAGCLASGFHHAKRDSGSGFCTLNGIAIAATYLAEKTGGNVLIIDLDAHCAGGTANMICDNPRLWQVDIATHAFDFYQPNERQQLYLVNRGNEYLPNVKHALRRVEDEWPAFKACIYYAGMDSHEHCETGGMKGIDEFVLMMREAIVFEWCQRVMKIPVAYGLGGGYISKRLKPERLVELHRLTIDTFKSN